MPGTIPRALCLIAWLSLAECGYPGTTEPEEDWDDMDYSQATSSSGDDTCSDNLNDCPVGGPGHSPGEHGGHGGHR